jgi:hypothetical protein
VRKAKEEEREAFDKSLPPGWSQEEKLKPDSRGLERACIVYVGPSGKKYASQAAVRKALEKEAVAAQQSTKSAGFMQGFLAGQKVAPAQKQSKRLSAEEEEARQAAAEDEAMCKALDEAEYRHAKGRKEREAADKIAKALDRYSIASSYTLKTHHTRHTLYSPCTASGQRDGAGGGYGEGGRSCANNGGHGE